MARGTFWPRFRHAPPERDTSAKYSRGMGARRGGDIPPRKCEHCGTEFVPSRPEGRFCSKKCSGLGTMTRLPDEERRCKVEGCDQLRIRTEPGYCSKHDYRYRFYGDPLATTSRQKRVAAPVDLEVDWEEIESTSYWTKNPTHCPEGHEYTEENTRIRKARDGTTRRVCKECIRIRARRKAAGVEPDRTATCRSCGVVWKASKFGTLPKFCQECAVRRQRNKSRANIGRKRGQTPKGPTYTCTACGVVSPTPARAGMPPKLCDVCANQNILDQKRALWVAKNLKRYSLTAERFAALIEEQGNTCAVCGTSQPGGGGRWHIDHDHSCCGDGTSCGECIRGLLCSKCNTALGLLDDEPGRLEAAVRYLTDPPAKRVL